MKFLITAAVDGDLELLDKTMQRHPETALTINLGDLCLHSKSTTLKYFLREKFRHQAEQSIEWNQSGRSFKKILWNLYGNADDPFIPLNEFGISNIVPIWSKVEDIISYNADYSKSLKIKCGFLSGYYNPKTFKNQNAYRNKMSRERKSLMLCKQDFEPFKNMPKLRYLFAHESPRYCPEIYTLAHNTQPKFAFFGHLRQWDLTDSWVHVGPLKEGYLILDTFNNTYDYYNS